MKNSKQDQAIEQVQAGIIAALGVKASINPQVEIQRRVQFLKDYVVNSGARGFVLGISGGQDSSLAGRLAQLAVEDLRDERGDESYTFTTMRLAYGDEGDAADVELVLDFIQPDNSMTYDIKPTVDAFRLTYDEMGVRLSDYAISNTMARMRMVAQYAYAGEHGLLVIGTDHASETVVGISTKFGDGGADLLPLSGLTKRQGKSLLEALDAPERLRVGGDLLNGGAGHPDTDEFGLSYDQLDDFLEGKTVDVAVASLVAERYFKTMHKREVPADSSPLV